MASNFYDRPHREPDDFAIDALIAEFLVITSETERRELLGDPPEGPLEIPELPPLNESQIPEEARLLWEAFHLNQPQKWRVMRPYPGSKLDQN